MFKFNVKASAFIPGAIVHHHPHGGPSAAVTSGHGEAAARAEAHRQRQMATSCPVWEEAYTGSGESDKKRPRLGNVKLPQKSKGWDSELVVMWCVNEELTEEGLRMALYAIDFEPELMKKSSSPGIWQIWFALCWEARSFKFAMREFAREEWYVPESQLRGQPKQAEEILPWFETAQWGDACIPDSVVEQVKADGVLCLV